MHCNVGPRHPLRQMFQGTVEQVFQADVGICDVSITDYLAQMLTEFVHIDDVFRLQSVTGDAIRDVSRMRALAELPRDASEEQQARMMNRYIGDFTLFWSGLYPEQLHARRSGRDRLAEYLVTGKRSYEIASELSGTQTRPPAELLLTLSEQFESCVHGLHLVRESWLSPPASDEAASN